MFRPDDLSPVRVAELAWTRGLANEINFEVYFYRHGRLL
jgi:hypothetical protein